MTPPAILDLPEHVNPHEDRTASAPYNFVPLPEVVVTDPDLPDHDWFHSERHTGYFDVTLSTLSPLYVRCPFTRGQFDLDERNKDRKGNDVTPQTPYTDRIKNTPEFFYTRDPDHPVIPGSSLRGMLRSLVEIVGYGKMQWVSDKNLFYRTVDNSTVGQDYRKRMGEHVRTGFMQVLDGQYRICVCQMARVHRDRLSGALYDGNGPNKTPHWNDLGHPSVRCYQYQPCWVRLNASELFVDEIKFEATPEMREGRLVLTGDMQGKRKEFVFLLPSGNAEIIPVHEDMIRRFHDDDQITQWQQRAFPTNQPESECRHRNGLLQKDPNAPGEPVFFLRENEKLTFWGRARMFRLPYQNRPIDLVPVELRQPGDIDFAEALFGYVDKDKTAPQGNKRRAYASRVFVTDASLGRHYEPKDLWLLGNSSQTLTPQILATPKPTAFQHYLTQTDDHKNDLNHYDTEKVVAIRGHKLYWHQGARASTDIAAHSVSANSTQHTQFRPVKQGVLFQFRVCFENLSDEELGALCWSLHPLGDASKTYCHSIGMGKSFGMGAVKLAATLHLTSRQDRYAQLLSADGQWNCGETTDARSLDERMALEKLVEPFEQNVFTGLNLQTQGYHLYNLRRIGILLKMLEWPGYPSYQPATLDNRVVTDNSLTRPNTRNMLLQLELNNKKYNEFRDRPVLPDPSQFGPLTGSAYPIANVEPTWAKPNTDIQPSVDEALESIQYSTPTIPPQPVKEPLPAVHERVSPQAEHIAAQIAQPNRVNEGDIFEATVVGITGTDYECRLGPGIRTLGRLRKDEQKDLKIGDKVRVKVKRIAQRGAAVLTVRGLPRATS